jgi:hypothetical protein
LQRWIALTTYQQQEVAKCRRRAEIARGQRRRYETSLELTLENIKCLLFTQENYLLQTRMQKMPYKHIAAHLKKTELACRLHYHQLSHGSHRRKRTGSVSSSNSSGSAYSTNSSPRSQYGLGYGHEDRHLDYRFGLDTTPSFNTHKVLLPKPAPLTPPDGDHQSLRINTQMQAAIAHANSQPGVDTHRLRAIYDQHRSTFWNQIAHDYGTDASPSQLEAIWNNPAGGPVMRPPTPGDSPDRMRPSLKPSPMPAFNPYGPGSYSATERTTLSPIAQYPGSVSAISDPGRMGYFPPTPNTGFGVTATPSMTPSMTPSIGSSMTPALNRNNTWGYQHAAPQPVAPTAISSLLTDNKCPRGTECTGINCKHSHY